MPYRLSSNKLCVEQQKDGVWVELKCYTDTQDAKDYLAALQSNVGDAKAMEVETTVTEDKMYDTMLTQSEAGYIIDATRKQPLGQMCKSCRFFEYPGACHIVQAFPEPIYPDGWCTWWTKKPVIEPEPMEVVIVEPELEDDDSGEYEVGMMSRYGVSVAPPVIDAVEKRTFQRDKVETAFKVLENGRWLAFFTNNFLDSDQEILRGKAHKEYVKRANAGLVDMPELWRGHIKGTRHGVAERLYYLETGKAITVFAIGTFDDTPAGKSAQRFYRKAKPGSISLSHGFVYPTWAKQDGEYKVYNTFEITTLKRGQEANMFTSFGTKGKDMLSAEQIEDLKAAFGDAAPGILEEVGKVDKGIQAVVELGVKHKAKGFTDFADMDAGDSTSAPDTSLDAKTLSAVKALVPTLLGDTAALSDGVLVLSQRLDAAEKSKNEAQEARIKALETELAGLKQYLQTGVTPASEAVSTVTYDPTKITPEMRALLPKEVKSMLDDLEAKQTGSNDYDPFFGDLKVKKR